MQGIQPANIASGQIATPARVRVATLNTRDLGDGKEQYELDGLGEVFHNVRADVWMLQEVSSKKELDAFCDQQLPKGAYPHRAFFQTNDKGNHHLAILSKYPIETTRTNRTRRLGMTASGTPIRFARDVARATVNIGKFPLTVYSSHLMAKRYDNTVGEAGFRDKMRLAEAKGVQDVFKTDFPQARVSTPAVRTGTVDPSSLKAVPKALYVIGLDANATPDSREVSVLKGKGTPTELVDPLEKSQPDAWTHPSSRERIDYLLFSPDLGPAVVPGSARAYAGPGSREASDHRAVYADIDVNKLGFLAS